MIIRASMMKFMPSDLTAAPTRLTMFTSSGDRILTMPANDAAARVLAFIYKLHRKYAPMALYTLFRIVGGMMYMPATCCNTETRKTTPGTPAPVRCRNATVWWLSLQASAGGRGRTSLS